MTTPTAAIAAGAAAAAARDFGADEQGQMQQGTLAAIVVEARERAAEDTLEQGNKPKECKVREHEDAQPRDGFLRKLMHWLNIR